MQRFWKLLCSLKLAIYLGCAATAVTMVGSLVLLYHPEIFGSMDRMALMQWYEAEGSRDPLLSCWVVATGILILLFALNTLCCFIDWLRRFKARWRKTGEYLIHLGFVLLVAGYTWGAFSGSRSEQNALAEGETMAVPGMPGHFLRLDKFSPTFAPTGRPLDMVADLTLLEGDAPVTSATARTNQPLMYEGLVVIPMSFGQSASGFTGFLNDAGQVRMVPGASFETRGGRLEILEFHPNLVRRPGGVLVPSGRELINPAFRLALESQGGRLEFWYVLREGLPRELSLKGIRLRPMQPIGSYHSLLTINRDPGAGPALAGGVSMTLGVFFALGSFYYKRSRGDRPEVV